MGDSVLTRLKYRRRFADTYERVLIEDACAEIERLLAVAPQDGELSAEQVLAWFGRHGVSLVPFQRQIFVRDFDLTPERVAELCPRPE